MNPPPPLQPRSATAGMEEFELSLPDLPPLPDVPRQKDHVPGYPALAGKMGQYMQLGITRGFWALAARNLLYYQAELTSLERELVQLENQDSNCVHDERREFAGSWEKLSGATGAKGEQWRKFREIRGVLKDYYEAVIQVSTVASMDDPCQYDLEYIQHYMQTREMGPEGIHGLDCYTYGWIGHPDKYAPDLRAITPKLNVDAFSKWFIHKVMDKFLGSRFHRQRKPSKVTGDIVYEQKNLLKITHFITCLVAAIPPMVATIALSYTSSFRIKLIVMAILNFLLVLFLSVFTKASRAEVFAAIAAFGGITVVFLGQNQSGCCNMGSGGHGP